MMHTKETCGGCHYYTPEDLDEPCYGCVRAFSGRQADHFKPKESAPTMGRCEYWDRGWCYHPSDTYNNGCVGRDYCLILKKKEHSRIDVIGSNGNDGSHYVVEEVARILAGEGHDKPLNGKMKGKKRWELHVQQAIAVLNYFEEHNT